MTRNDIVFAARTTISSTGTTNWRMSTVLGLLCGRRTDDWEAIVTLTWVRFRLTRSTATWRSVRGPTTDHSSASNSTRPRAVDTDSSSRFSPWSPSNATHATPQYAPFLSLRFGRCVASVGCVGSVRCVLACAYFSCVACVSCVKKYARPCVALDGRRPAIATADATVTWSVSLSVSERIVKIGQYLVTLWQKLFDSQISSNAEKRRLRRGMEEGGRRGLLPTHPRFSEITQFWPETPPFGGIWEQN